MGRIHSSFFVTENAQIIILFEIPGEGGVAGKKGEGQKNVNTIVFPNKVELARDPETKL